MKKLYFLLVFLSVGLSFSQTILNQPETTSRTVEDPQEIKMAPGFSAYSVNINSFIARISNSENPTDSNAGSDNPSGPVGNIMFHDTQGNIEVNGGGQLQFTLPIALPPGVKSVAPQINVIYTSGSSNGIAGYGWSISGVTSISRVGKTIINDGEVKGIQLDYSDYYNFNGQRLILRSGEYGKDGAEYVTEKYSNVKIRSIGNASGQQWQGPLYWVVTFEDGSQAWYGATGTSTNYAKTPVDYNIVKWRDPQGNIIEYSYEQYYNSAIITRISWGGNDVLGKNNFNEILFNYKERDLKEATYVNGVQLVQSKLLRNLTVNTNGIQFKKYDIAYKKNGTNYEFVDYISEKVSVVKDGNAVDEVANSVVFNYKTDAGVTNIFNQGSRYDDIYGDNIISGDFNGDGKIDFVKGKKIMIGRLDGNNQIYDINIEGNPVASGSYLKNGVLLNKQVLYTFVPLYTQKKLKINVYEYTVNNNVDLIKSSEYDLSQFSYIFDETPPPLPPVMDEEGNKCPGAYNDDGDWVCYPWTYTYALYGKAQEADFNGDGISDLLITLTQDQNTRVWEWGLSGNMEQTGAEYGVRERELKLFWDFSDGIKASEFPKVATLGDFNGNGKTDIVEIKNNNLDVYELNSDKQFIKLFSTNKESLNEVVYTGDFNGDGKTDILAPIANDSSDWRIYISTGNSFKKEYYSNLFLYQPVWQGAPRKNRNIQRIYSTSDLNKDGKSDLIIFESQVWFRDGVFDWNNPDSSYGFNYLRNEGVDTNGKPVFTNAYKIDPKELDWDGEDLNYSMYGEHYIPLFGNFRIAQLNTDFAIIHKTKLITWDLGNKVNNISKITSISQGGLLTEIEYAPLISNDNIYSSYYGSSPLQYPYVNITENLNYDVVSRLIQGSRKQDFRYRDMIGHLQGKGMIGFRQSARSTFYSDEFVTTKIWSGSETDPLNEGLPKKEWTIKTTDENSVFPQDISLESTQLLSYKNYEYKIDKLLNGNVVSNYSDSEKPKIVTSISPHITTSKDFQKNIKTVHTVVTYDDLYLPTKSTTDVNDGFAITTSEISYYPPSLTVGSDYAIGKPKWKSESITAYGDTKSGKEEYEYNNGLLTKKRTFNRDDSEYIEEEYSYDGFGNIVQKTVNNPFNSDQVQSATTTSQYDDKGRFVIKKTDNIGLETKITYDNWGQLLTQTDPLNNKLTNTYDVWGKLLTSKTNLGGLTTYTYEKLSNGDTKITEYSPDNDQNITYTNKLGQNYRSSVKGFSQGSYISSDIIFDALGRKTGESEPYSGSSATKWNTTKYDDFSRPTKFTSFTGKIIETTYNDANRTVTATETNANNRFKTQAFDAMGNLSSVIDMGGTISYKYNASGENIESKYGANIVSTIYDHWGRKSEFNDPSNGLYKYEYNGYGQITHSISPKGHKYYQYNSLGQLYDQIENSNDNGSTDKKITYKYDIKGRVIKKSGTSQGELYVSYVNYDANGRMTATGENSNGKKFFNKNVVYDEMGRVVSYEKGLSSSGIDTKVDIENHYSDWNGELYRVKDKTTGSILWELTDSNEKGQMVKAKLGGSNIENTYDGNNFLHIVNHTNTANNNAILYIKYNFDAIKNELLSRTTGGTLNILESFTYDTNNRLVSWTNPKTGQTSTNLYDAKGRITENDQIGTMKFEDTSKIYRPTGAVLNANGEQNYTNDLIQKISYNENNDPVFIDGEKGDVSFSYGLTSMRQLVTYGGNFGEGNTGKYTKYYSEDGSFEITLDKTTGKEKHILFIGGDPYSSNIIFVKNYEESSGSFKFLHKDHLGSILAITNETGAILEQRHFDAWGNLTLFKVNGIDKDLSKFNELSLLDRGYTSHEHYSEVVLIHMNGRLYDPLLRRFLNADEFIQDIQNTQNYNKYGYVMNNPLLYNDPSGEIMGWDDALIAIGVAVFSSIASDYYMNRPVNIGSMFQSVVISLMSAGMADGIGTVFSVAKDAKIGAKILNAIAKAGAHGFSQGVISGVQGGNFLSGALSGTFASVSNDLLGNWIINKPKNEFLNSKGFAMLTGAVSGGSGSVMGGGNFWMGAVQGFVVTTFNYLAHGITDNNGGDNPKEESSVMKILKENTPIGIYGTDPESLFINFIGSNFVAGVNNIHDTFYFLDSSGVGRASFRTVRTLYMSISNKQANSSQAAQKIFAKAIDAGLDALSLKVKLQEGIFYQQEMDLLLKNTIDLNLRFEKGTSSFQAPMGIPRKFIYSNWRGSWF